MAGKIKDDTGTGILPALYLYFRCMKLRIHLISFLIFSALTVAAQTYREDMEAWDKARVKELKAESGWLNLAGLFWLREGENSFGSGASNDVRFPDGKIPASAGVMEKKGSSVILKPLVRITINGKETGPLIVFDPDSVKNPIMQYGDLRWNIIKRDDRIGVRLRDLKHPALDSFKGIPRYPLDTSMVIKARYEPHAVPTSIPITNMLGQTYAQFSPGLVHFSMNGQEFSFISLEEEGMLFLVFGDDTNEIETYSAGRFLKAIKPEGPGTTILDFNKAYNPPCAFTPFATCPLPPKQNIIPFGVRVGERKYH
jgi:uncharacterized protein (DUF1684 family)